MEEIRKSRPTWHEYFLNFAELASKRSTCLRRHVGAVAVKDKRILATGYNGVPPGQDHCEKTGCLRQQLNIASGQRHEICRGIHAEQNLIIQAALHGVCLYQSVIYCTHMPCYICAKMLIGCGVKEIYFVDGYPDEFTSKLFTEARVSSTMLKVKDK